MQCAATRFPSATPHSCLMPASAPSAHAWLKSGAHCGHPGGQAGRNSGQAGVSRQPGGGLQNWAAAAAAAAAAPVAGARNADRAPGEEWCRRSKARTQSLAPTPLAAPPSYPRITSWRNPVGGRSDGGRAMRESGGAGDSGLPESAEGISSALDCSDGCVDDGATDAG